MCLEILKWRFQDEWIYVCISNTNLALFSSFLLIVNCYRIAIAMLSLCNLTLILSRVHLKMQAPRSSWISTGTLVKGFAVKQVLPLTSKYKLAGVTRLLRVLDIKRRISYATWAEVDEQQAHYDRIFTVCQRVRNPVIELAKICRVRYLPFRALDFYWFTDCRRVVRILTIDRSWNTYAKLTVKSQTKPIGRRFLFFTSKKIRSLDRRSNLFSFFLSTDLTS